MIVSRSRRLGSALFIVLLLCPAAAAYANLPIFFVFAGARVTLWWTVLAAIGIEAAVLWYLFNLRPLRALWLAALVNIATSLLGFAIYPFIGMLSYPAVAPFVTSAFGTGSTVEIVAYCVAAAVIDTPIELGLLVLISTIWGLGVKVSWQPALFFFLANLISASVLIAALQIGPPKPPIDDETRLLLEEQFADETTFAKMVLNELPAHTRSNGDVDARWLFRLGLQAEGMAFLELSTWSQHGQLNLIVPLKNRGVGYSYVFSYGETVYDGDIRITPGQLSEWANEAEVPHATLDVIHYEVLMDMDGTSYRVKAILGPLPVT